MFSSKKAKLVWQKIKNKITLVLYLSNIYELMFLKNFKYILKIKNNCVKGSYFQNLLLCYLHELYYEI
jgi:hypothetical protein